MTRSTLSEQDAFCLACLVPLLCANVIQVLVMYHYSIDRGMWPLVLAISALISIVYAGMATVLAYIYRSCKPAAIVRHASILGLVLIADTIAWYIARPDSLAIHSGRDRLTTLQRVIYSSGMPWLIYLFFYIVLFIRFLGRSRSE